jgi:hypothetical protein
LAGLYQAVNAYARRLQVAGPNAIGLFYYSGHGAADAGTNYLIPVDVKTTETNELWDQSLRLTEITRKLKTEAGNATHFVVFDACRNTLKLTHAGSRSLMQSKGFVPVGQESGMLIAYATAEGELASDMGSGAGPYASVLAEEIVKPGFEAVTMFRNVQRRVRMAINQEPYLGFNAMGVVYLADAGLPKVTPQATPKNAARFDGTWLFKIDCPKVDGAAGYNDWLPVRVTNGFLTGEGGSKEGSGYWHKLQGQIDADGAALLTADPKIITPTAAIGRPPVGTFFAYVVRARFEVTRGTGKRIIGRDCDVRFEKQ